MNTQSDLYNHRLGRGTAPAWISLGVALLGAVLVSGCGEKKSTAEAAAPPPAPVKTQVLATSALEDASEYVGALEAQKKVELKPEIEGRIAQIAVTYGQRVARGDLIMQLRPDQTQTQLQAAQANAAATGQAQKTAEANLRQAQAERETAVAELALQKVNYKRAQELVAAGAQAQITLDTETKNLDVAQADLRAADQAVQASGAAVDQAKANLRNAQAAVGTAQVPLQYKQLRAPIAGAVGNFSVKVGDYVNTGQTLTTITRNDALDLKISVPSNRSSQLRPGTEVELVDPDTEKRLTKGRVYFISSEVASGAQSILTRARFANSDGRLRDGQFVKARVIWSRRPGVLVPVVGVSRIGAQDFVYVADQQQVQGKVQTVARQRPVQLGEPQGQSYQIVSGLKPGDRVVVSGILRLRDGAPIQPQS